MNEFIQTLIKLGITPKLERGESRYWEVVDGEQVLMQASIVYEPSDDMVQVSVRDLSGDFPVDVLWGEIHNDWNNCTMNQQPINYRKFAVEFFNQIKMMKPSVEHKADQIDRT